jgi:hypothetical protein
MVESHTIYNGLVTEQTSYAVNVLLPNFLNNTKPKNIVEIGTAVGGLTHLLSDLCPDSKIITIETKNFYHYNFKENVTSIISDSNSTDLINDIMIPFIQKNGTTIVFCDGGNKVIDFSNYAPLIKNGDYICVHDYCQTKEIFLNEYYGKIWNYCRLIDKDILGICEQYGLVNVYPEMDRGMWGVKQKKSDIVVTKKIKRMI